MHRIAAFIGTLVATILVALPAWAQPYPPQGELERNVTGQGGAGGAGGAGEAAGGGGLALTGSEIALWAVIGVTLLVAGLFLVRHRQSRVESSV